MATVPHPSQDARVQGVLDATRNLAASAWDHVGTRFDLMVLELAEERARLARGVAAGSLAVACAALAAAFAGMALLVWLGDTPDRMLAAAALPILFALGSLVAARVARSTLGRESVLFRTSLKEFRHDREALTSYRNRS